MRRTHYKRGDWNVICDVSGKKLKASQTRLRWDGLRVQKPDYEERHPQDFVRAIPDDQSVPWTRSESQDVFIDTCNYMEGGYIARGYYATECPTDLSNYMQEGYIAEGYFQKE